MFREFLENLKPVKQDKAEELFEKRIAYLRKREEFYLERVHLYRAIAAFFMQLTPLFSILFILWLEVLRGKELDITTAFTVVVIVNSMNKPLRRFVDILDRHYEYNHAKESLNRLLFLIPEKPKQAIYDDELTTGEVVFKNCDVEMDDDSMVKTALSRIFGDEIDIEQELMEFTKEIKKEKQGVKPTKPVIMVNAPDGEEVKIEEKVKKEEEKDEPSEKSKRGKKKKEKKKGRAKTHLNVVKKESLHDMLPLKSRTEKIKEKKPFQRSFTAQLKDSQKNQKSISTATKKIVISNFNLHIKPHTKLFFIDAPATSKVLDSVGITSASGSKKKLELDNTHPHHIIYSLLGENYLPNPGSLRYKGKIVYQNSKNPLFLPRQSLQDNILFGEVMIKSRYELVLETVGLNVNSYPGGDMFEVTERGQNLSTTEMKKVLLCRMLYVSGDIYIIEGFFDDDISSDPNTNNTEPEKTIPKNNNKKKGRDKARERRVSIIGERAKDKRTKKAKKEAYELKQMFWEKVMEEKSGLLANKTVIIVEDMSGKLHNAFNHKSIMEKVDKIVLFGSKVRNKSGSGVRQFNNFKQYANYIKTLLGDRAEQIFSLMEISLTPRLRAFRNSSPPKKKTLKTIIKDKEMNTFKWPPFVSSIGAFNPFSDSQIAILKKKRETDPFTPTSTMNALKDNALKKDRKDSQDTPTLPLKDQLGYQISKFLTPGVVSVVEKKTKGMIKSQYNNDKIYRITIKLTQIYLFILGKCRIYRELIFFVLTVVIFISIDIFMGLWSNRVLESQFGVENNLSMIIYLVITVLASFAVFFRDVTFTTTLMHNAKQVHNQMMNKFSQVSLNWMEANYDAEVGFMLSYDMRRIDSRLNLQLENFFEATAFVVGGLLLLNYQYMGLVLLIHIFLIVYLFFTLRLFLKTTKNIVKFIAENTALLQDVLNQTMDQIFMYRVMSADSIMHRKFKNINNEMQRAMTHLGFYCLRWLGVRLGWVNITLIFTAYFIPIVLVVFLSDLNFELSKFELGLAISWSLKLVGFLTTAANNYVKTQIDVVSYGRMHHFLHEVETQEDSHDKFSLEGPNRGDQPTLLLENISLKFGKRKVLNKINLRIDNREVIGIIGQSGSGKHTLCNLILRVYDTDDFVAQRRMKRRKERGKMTLMDRMDQSIRNSIDPRKKKKKTFLIEELSDEEGNDSEKNGKKKLEMVEEKQSEQSFTPRGSHKPRLLILGANVEDTNHKDHQRYVAYLKPDPVLYSGRIRENIDPGFRYSDDEIMSVLKYLDGVEVLSENWIQKWDFNLNEKNKEKFKKVKGSPWRQGEIDRLSLNKTNTQLGSSKLKDKSLEKINEDEEDAGEDSQKDQNDQKQEKSQQNESKNSSPEGSQSSESKKEDRDEDDSVIIINQAKSSFSDSQSGSQESESDSSSDSPKNSQKFENRLSKDKDINLKTENSKQGPSFLEPKEHIPKSFINLTIPIPSKSEVAHLTLPDESPSRIKITQPEASEYSVISGVEKLTIQKSIPTELQEVDLMTLENSNRRGKPRDPLNMGEIFDSQRKKKKLRLQKMETRDRRDSRDTPGATIESTKIDKQELKLNLNLAIPKVKKKSDLPKLNYLNNPDSLNTIKDNKPSVTKSRRSSCFKIGAREPRKSIMSKIGLLQSSVIPTEVLDDHANEALRQELSDYDKKILKEFLMNLVTSHTTQDFPLPLLKLIKATKMVLERPRIALIDKSSLRFSPKRGIEEMICLLMTTKDLEKTSFLFIFTEVPESMFLFDRVVCMEKGYISQQGTTSEIIRSWLETINAQLRDAQNQRNEHLKTKLDVKKFKIENLQFLIDEVKEVTKSKYMMKMAFGTPEEQIEELIANSDSSSEFLEPMRLTSAFAGKKAQKKDMLGVGRKSGNVSARNQGGMSGGQELPSSSSKSFRWFLLMKILIV